MRPILVSTEWVESTHQNSEKAHSTTCEMKSTVEKKTFFRNCGGTIWVVNNLLMLISGFLFSFIHGTGKSDDPPMTTAMRQ